MRHISIHRDGRKKKHRIRVGKFDAAFTSRDTAIHIASIERRMSYA